MDICGSPQFRFLSSHTITKTTLKFTLLGSDRCEEAVGVDGVGGSRVVSRLRLETGGQHWAGPESWLGAETRHPRVGLAPRAGPATDGHYER